MGIQTTRAGLMLSSWAMVGSATLAMLASSTETMMANNNVAAAGMRCLRASPSGCACLAEDRVAVVVVCGVSLLKYLLTRLFVFRCFFGGTAPLGIGLLGCP